MALGLDLENLQRRCDISTILSSQIYPERMESYRGTSESLEDLKLLVCEACVLLLLYLQRPASYSDLPKFLVCEARVFLATVCAANGFML